MSELKPCPFCGEDATMQAPNMHRKTCISCKECGMSTGWGSVEAVTAAWNRRAQPNHIGDSNKMIAQPNEPLTIDDIKTLDYEPIWVEDISGCNTSCWAIAGRTRGSGIELYDEHCGEHYIDFAAWDNYGKTWVAYRRNPEPEGGDR